MTRLWEPTIRIGARTERLTTDHADRDASGGLVTIRLGTKYSNKLTRPQWGIYEAAKQAGYIALPNRRKDTARLKNVWFTWCEAAYHPYVNMVRYRGAYDVELDLIAFCAMFEPATVCCADPWKDAREAARDALAVACEQSGSPDWQAGMVWTMAWKVPEVAAPDLARQFVTIGTTLLDAALHILPEVPNNAQT
jgi:hypothetical protein